MKHGLICDTQNWKYPLFTPGQEIKSNAVRFRQLLGP